MTTQVPGWEAQVLWSIVRLPGHSAASVPLAHIDKPDHIPRRCEIPLEISKRKHERARVDIRVKRNRPGRLEFAIEEHANVVIRVMNQPERRHGSRRNAEVGLDPLR